MGVAGITTAGTNRAGLDRGSLWDRFAVSLALYCALAVILILATTLPFATDYIGGDNDDTMRLVEVRDFLGGQGWFDLMQYRLGLGDGTLMHWSRLIDLPIASLIRFFALFAGPERAEALAAAAWPLLLTLPLLAALGLGARRLGGTVAMHVAFALGVLFLVTTNRFLPGALDHHNVQLTLVAWMAAMLIDARMRASSLAVAGFCAALAIAIGAETTPLVAIVCLIVAISWLLVGQAYRRAAAAYGLSLALFISLFFFATVPPHLYGARTCDNLSISYYGLASIGGLLLAVSALAFSGRSLAVRAGLLAVDGLIAGAAVLILAPHCLQGPLADLDPMLVKFWLSHVSEAYSALEELKLDPGKFGGFYAVGLFGLSVCLFRALKGDRAFQHWTLFAMILVAWGVALIQVRGAVFSDMLAIPPLAFLIAELRDISRREPENPSKSFAFAVSVLMAVSSVWGFAGMLLTNGTAEVTESFANTVSASEDCRSGSAMRQLAGLKAATVAAPVDSGAQILRFTHHRVIAGPYHRDQGGMLTELHIGLAPPSEAPAFLRGADIGIVAFCPSDYQTQFLIDSKPDGLFAALKRGDVPPYLVPLPKDPQSGFQLYRVALGKN
ncbi:hypothetical protein [Rhizobium halophytocola]|uniref:GtrA family protein n=1 Tax=Rhizobium halophytocola TaxID=735519 RepID=A0ABS4DZZ0_9HYPH|nr:hypothetical protein [Rhizobium halophytocola]MBP1851259.1 hypothetical protein [Rhizobium halophytocola]